MSLKANIIRLFLSSPGDVENERNMVHEVAAQLNRMMGEQMRFRLEVIDWETHVTPNMGRPQEVINQQIRDYDIFVGIMWKRFGTPTGKADSGTEEEFNIACKNWEKYGRPRIMLYFNQTPYMPKNTKEISQFARVVKFREKLQDGNALVWEYQNPVEFQEFLIEHLGKVLYEFSPAEKDKVTAPSFSKYLSCLREETLHMNIRGLTSGKGKAYQFNIDDLYIPLKTSETVKTERQSKKIDEAIQREVPLQQALQHDRLLIRGEPGAGKTTFLKLLTYTL